MCDYSQVAVLPSDRTVSPNGIQFRPMTSVFAFCPRTFSLPAPAYQTTGHTKCSSAFLAETVMMVKARAVKPCHTLRRTLLCPVCSCSCSSGGQETPVADDDLLPATGDPSAPQSGRACCCCCLVLVSTCIGLATTRASVTQRVLV